MEFILITNNPEMATFAEQSGVNRIMIDLELLGKKERQGHLNTVISKHTLEDVAKVRKFISKSKLLVRINPLNENSKKEIDEIIRLGADIIMLPMFTTAREVETFISIVEGRAITNLLLETPQALVRINDILAVKGIDEIHIGLNDLHLGMGLKFMFELLSGGIIEYLSEKIVSKGIKFGFGGISRLGKGTLDSSLILSEHVRLNSEMVILSRDFHGNSKNLEELREFIDLKKEIINIRNYLGDIDNFTKEKLISNAMIIKEKVNNITKN